MRSLPVVVGLLRDADDDVVLQAVLILGRLRDPRALEPLHSVLGHADPNVRQEAILAIGALGDARSIPHLTPFLDADPWVQMAAVQALGDLRAPDAVPYVAARLTDPLVGSLAAEALARIGGEPAFRALADHWPGPAGSRSTTRRCSASSPTLLRDFSATGTSAKISRARSRRRPFPPASARRSRRGSTTARPR